MKRAHLPACVWKHALDSDPPDISLADFEWLPEETTQTLSPVAVPNGTALAPEEILDLIKCQCDILRNHVQQGTARLHNGLCMSEKNYQ